MGLADTYWLSNNALPGYDGDACVEVEYGKVRSAGFIRARTLDALLADVYNVTLWQTLIGTGEVVLMPFVSGAFDPGEPKALKGYGRRPATRGPREQLVTWSDPSYVLNYGFYDNLHRHKDFVPFFRTSTSLHIGRSISDVFAQNEVSEDLDTEVAWRVSAKMRHTFLPQRFDADPLRTLFQQTDQQRTVLHFASGLSQTVVGLRLVIRIRVGPGEVLEDGDVAISNPAFVGKRVLVLASGTGLPVDDPEDPLNLDWTGSVERHVLKPLSSSEVILVNGAASQPEILEYYTYAL